MDQDSLPDISFSEIRSFNVAVETGSVSEAARRLGLTQPAVSKQLMRLEQKLNIRLFDRTFQRLRLTLAGQHFHAYAAGSYAAFEDTIHAIRDEKGLMDGELRIAASTTPGDYLVPRWLNDFGAVYPGIKAIVSISDSDRVLEDILDRSWDVGFVGDMPSDRRLACHAVAEDEVVLAVRHDHPFARKRVIRLRDLGGQRFIGREEGSATARTVRRALEAHGLAPPETSLVMVLNSVQACLSAVQRGIGICWASTRSLEAPLVQGVVPVRLKEVRFHRSLYMVHMERGLPPVAEMFVQWLLAGLSDEATMNGSQP